VLVCTKLLPCRVQYSRRRRFPLGSSKLSTGRCGDPGRGFKASLRGDWVALSSPEKEHREERARRGGARSGGARRGGTRKGGARRGGAQIGGARRGGARKGGARKGGERRSKERRSTERRSSTTPAGKRLRQVFRRFEGGEGGGGSSRFFPEGVRAAAASAGAFRSPSPSHPSTLSSIFSAYVHSAMILLPSPCLSTTNAARRAFA